MQAQGGPSRAKALGQGTTEVHVSEQNPGWPAGGFPAKTHCKKGFLNVARKHFYPPLEIWYHVCLLVLGGWGEDKTKFKKKKKPTFETFTFHKKGGEGINGNIQLIPLPTCSDVEVFVSPCSGGADLMQRRGFSPSSKKRWPNYNSQLRLSAVLCIADCHAGCWIQNKFPKPGLEPQTGSLCRIKKKKKRKKQQVNMYIKKKSIFLFLRHFSIYNVMKWGPSPTK